MPLPRNRFFRRRRRNVQPTSGNRGYFLRRLLQLFLPCIFGNSNRVAPFTTEGNPVDQIPSKRGRFQGKSGADIHCGGQGTSSKESTRSKMYEAWTIESPVPEDSNSDDSDGEGEGMNYTCYERTPVEKISNDGRSIPRHIAENYPHPSTWYETPRGISNKYVDFRKYGFDNNDIRRIFGVTANTGIRVTKNETDTAMTEFDKVLLDCEKRTPKQESPSSTLVENGEPQGRSLRAINVPRPKGPGHQMKFGLTILEIPCSPPEIKRNKDVGHRCSLRDLRQKMLDRVSCDLHHPGNVCNHNGIFQAAVHRLFAKMSASRNANESASHTSSPATKAELSMNKDTYLFNPSLPYTKQAYTQRKNFDDVVLEDVEQF